MKRLIVIAVSLFSLLAGAAVCAAQADWLERMAVCQDSWYEWRDSDAQLDAWQARVNKHFIRRGRQFRVRAPMTVFGYPVLNLSPDRFGLARGFAVIIDGKFEQVRQTLKEGQGLTYQTCENRGCREEVAPQKTRVLRPTRSASHTVIGCVYEFSR